MPVRPTGLVTRRSSSALLRLRPTTGCHSRKCRTASDGPGDDPSNGACNAVARVPSAPSPSWRGTARGRMALRCAGGVLAGGGARGRCGGGKPPAAGAGRTTDPTTTTSCHAPRRRRPRCRSPRYLDACGRPPVRDPRRPARTTPSPRAPPSGSPWSATRPRIPAGPHRSLVIDPGGPGVSGIDDLANELDALTPQLLDDFDIVHVRSSRRRAQRPGELRGGARQRPRPGARSMPQTRRASRRLRRACGSSPPPARRPARRCSPTSVRSTWPATWTGCARRWETAGLTYMGQSYGTLLGLTYAQLFPTHIRAMVLDSVIDPALSFNQTHAGAGPRLRGSCSTPSSPGAPRPRRAGWPRRRTRPRRSSLCSAAADSAGAGGGRAHRRARARSTMPCSTACTPNGVAAAGCRARRRRRRRGAGIVAMSNSYNAGGSTNGSDVAVAVDCLDHPAVAGPRGVRLPGRLVRCQAAPVFGPLLAWGEEACAVWPMPHPDRRPRQGERPGAAHPGRRHDGRPGHPLRLGGQRGHRTGPRCAADPSRRRPRGVLLQRVRPVVRPDLFRQRDDTAAGDRVRLLKMRSIRRTLR